MNKKTLIIGLIGAFSVFIIACGGSSDSGKTGTEPTENPTSTSTSTNPDDYDPNRGIGKFDESNVEVGPLNAEMAKRGEAISGTKCLSCHKLSDERLVGPGWKDVTNRRTPHWLMNFITNPDPMIDKDPEVQAQLELCLVRMPNQNLTDNDARDILEYMRQNDNAQ